MGAGIKRREGLCRCQAARGRNHPRAKGRPDDIDIHIGRYNDLGACVAAPGDIVSVQDRACPDDRIVAEMDGEVFYRCQRVRRIQRHLDHPDSGVIDCLCYCDHLIWPHSAQYRDDWHRGYGIAQPNRIVAAHNKASCLNMPVTVQVEPALVKPAAVRHRWPLPRRGTYFDPPR